MNKLLWMPVLKIKSSVTKFWYGLEYTATYTPKYAEITVKNCPKIYKNYLIVVLLKKVNDIGSVSSQLQTFNHNIKKVHSLYNWEFPENLIKTCKRCKTSHIRLTNCSMKAKRTLLPFTCSVKYK